MLWFWDHILICCESVGIQSLIAVDMIFSSMSSGLFVRIQKSSKSDGKTQQGRTRAIETGKPTKKPGNQMRRSRQRVVA